MPRMSVAMGVGGRGVGSDTVDSCGVSGIGSVARFSRQAVQVVVRASASHHAFVPAGRSPEQLAHVPAYRRRINLVGMDPPLWSPVSAERRNDLKRDVLSRRWTVNRHPENRLLVTAKSGDAPAMMESWIGFRQECAKAWLATVSERQVAQRPR